jgi:bifunctional non-homologous end joining protein LigD
VANLAALELHTSMARAVDPDSPTMIVFDLDPGPPAGLLECAEVGLWLRRVFDDLGLVSLVKTSGSKGLQVYLPLNTPSSYAETAGFSRTLAQLMEQEHRELVVSVQKKSLRTGKVLVDWSQNSRHKTTACVYTMRAREQPTVSTPVTWDEVEAAFDAADPSLLTFDFRQVLARVDEHGDLFAEAATVEQRLPR